MVNKISSKELSIVVSHYFNLIIMIFIKLEVYIIFSRRGAGKSPHPWVPINVLQLKNIYITRRKR